MNEADVKRKIVKAVKDAGGYARRIEDQFSVGFPDLILFLKKSPIYFAEVKLIPGNVFGPTARQLVELHRLSINSLSWPVVIGYKDGIYYMGVPAEQYNIKGADNGLMKSDNIVTLLGEFHVRQS